MSLNTMSQRLVLEDPGIAADYARTLLREALGFICDSRLWSWQLQTAGFLTPGLLFPGGPGVSLGTITVTPYSNQIIGDAVSSAARQAYIANNTRPLFTELQTRTPASTLFSTIAIDKGTTTPPFTTIRIAPPWMEPKGASQAYMIYQAYF